MFVAEADADRVVEDVSGISSCASGWLWKGLGAVVGTVAGIADAAGAGAAMLI